MSVRKRLQFPVGQRVYWRSLFGDLIAGTVVDLILDTELRDGRSSLRLTYLVQPDGECMGAPHFSLWMSGHGFMRLPETIETSVD